MNKIVTNIKYLTKDFILLFVFFYLSMPLFLEAQASAFSNDYTIQVRQFGIENGLIHRSVQCVFEDRNGFIWIGTDKGLQRYDGHDFKTWTKANKTGLLYYISSIGQDDQGWLWLWNNDRLKFVFLHPETEEILSEEERFGLDFPIHKQEGSLDGWDNGFKRLPTDSTGKLYFSLKNGQIITYSGQEGLQSYIFPLSSRSFRLQFIDNQNHIWVVVDKSTLYEFSPKAEILHVFDLKKQLNTTQEVTTSEFSQDEHYIYFFLARRMAKPSQKPRIMKIDKNREIHFVKKTNRLLNTIQLGKLWEQTILGWKIYDINTNELLFTLDRENYDNSLFHSSFSPFIDSQERVWIYGQLGLNKVLLRSSRFRKYIAFEEENKKPFNNSARGLWVEKDTVFVNFEASHTLYFNINNPDNWTILSADAEARPLMRKNNGDILLGYPRTLRLVCLPVVKS